MSRQHLNEQQLAAYVYNNAECKLIVCDASTGRRVNFNTFAELKELGKKFRQDPEFHQRRGRGKVQAVNLNPSADAAPAGSSTNPTAYWLDGPTTVINIREFPHLVSLPNFVDIRRNSIFGNPFHVDIYGRVGAVNAYEHYLRENSFLLNKIDALRGFYLGCTCHSICHGQIIVKIINERL